MSHTEPVEHIDPEELADYFEEILPEGREGEIDEHFAECEACVLQARQYRVFAELWNGWTAAEHGEAYRRAELMRGLQQAEVSEKDPIWRERLRRWRERLPGTRGAIVRVIREAKETALRVVAESVEVLFPSVGEEEFAFDSGASGAVRTRGSVRVRGAGPVRTRGRRETQPQVTVSGEKGAVEVRVGALPLGQEPLVLLIPTKEGAEPQVQKPKEQAGVLIARFEDIEPGDYVVAFEPMER